MNESLSSAVSLLLPDEQQVFDRLETEAGSYDVFPLSFTQERLWFLDQLEPGSPMYNVPVAVLARGVLRADVLGRVLDAIAARHEILRTRFLAAGGRPVQVVVAQAGVPLEVHDLSGAANPEAEARRLIREEACRPFDLAAGPLIRGLLLELGESESILLLNLHHVVTDGWSNGILVREVTELYGALLAGRPPRLPKLPIQYADFAVWQREWLAGESLEQQLAYWRTRLAGLPPLELPTDRPRPARRGTGGGLRPAPLGRELSTGLEALARREGVTVFTVLLGILAVLLHRYSGQDDLTVGSPIANRNRSEVEDLIGCFVNTLVLRAEMAGDPTFHELLARLHDTVLGAYTHQDLPFERLVEEMEPERSLSSTPLFQVMLMLQNAPQGELRLPGATLSMLPVETGTAKFDLTLAFEETADGLAGYVEYSASLFFPETIDRLAGHFQTLAAAVAAGREARPRISGLPLLTEGEIRQLLAGWNDTARPFASGACVHQLVERQVDATPDAVAVRFGGVPMSFHELDGRANQLAWTLWRLGVGPDVRVGVSVERSAELVVSLLAVLKAGGAYVPLDPAFPADRRALMMEDAGVAAVIVRQRPARELSVPVIALDEVSAERDDRPAVPVAPGNLAYVIYTSGSTGRPKGVMLSHRNVANFFAGMDGVLGVEPGVWLAVTSVSFDISVLELLWTLARGFEVVVQEEGARVEVGAISDLAPSPTPAAAATVTRPLDFSLFYFASEETGRDGGYRLLLEGAKMADRHGFTAVWTPERHFHSFGGLFPNPSVVSAALAAVTERVRIRAGSVVLPLQNPLRVAEEWAVVDRLSNGRAGVSFASGWHADDFVLAPESFHDRKELMLRGIDTVRRLWRGETVSLPNGTGQAVDVRIHPLPVQPGLPVWLTAAGNPETFQMAGELGAGVLTHLLGQDLDDLARKIALYRETWHRHGHVGEGQVTLMLHSLVGEDLEEVRELVREPFCNYLRTSLGLIRNLARAMGRDVDADALSTEDERALLHHIFDRFFATSGLMGTLDTCLRQLERIRAIGVDEVGCLIDFGVDTDVVLASLERLAELRDRDRDRPVAMTAMTAPLRLRGVTHLQCTPSMARMIALEPDALAALGPLRQLLLGGEALSAELARQLRGTVAGEIHDMYGPTETTVWSTTHRLDEVGESVPIGRPIANTEVYVLDARLQPIPVGVPGELWIGGEGVARGYLGQPGLTAERFLPDPFGRHPGGRLYRTGDRVRWRPDGVLDYLGRADFQVKVRGFRIEPGEVEAALRHDPRVVEAVVIAREDRPGDRRLVAYLVFAVGAGLSVTELRESLAGRLPEHMIPAAFVTLEALPLTPNGKVDRKALPAPEGERPRLAVAYEAPETELQKVVAGVWCEVLQVSEVGMRDNFFEMGGTSLSLVEVRARLRHVLEIDVSLVDLFRAPTVASLAALVGSRGAAEAAAPSYGDARQRARRRKEALRRRPAGVESAGTDEAAVEA